MAKKHKLHQINFSKYRYTTVEDGQEVELTEIKAIQRAMKAKKKNIIITARS